MGIKTTQEQFEELWALYHSARDSTTHIKIPKESLFNLLTDHATMVGELKL
jgi:mannose-6-phosphate isomerase class I